MHQAYVEASGHANGKHVSNDESNKQTETVSARAHGEVDSCHNAESAGSLQNQPLSNRGDGPSETAASPSARRVVLLVEITSSSTGDDVQPADALTFIAEHVAASADAMVAAFNESQGRRKNGVQLNISTSRAVGTSKRTPHGLEFVSVDDCDDDDIETDERADARPELTPAGYVAAVRASRTLGTRS